jgi:hypothetical protein
MKKILLGVLVAVFFAAALFYFLFMTTQGSRLLVHQAISRVAPHESGAQEIVTGNIITGVTMENFELNEIEGLPSGSSLRIQKLYIKGEMFAPESLAVDVENARLRISSSDPLVLKGSIKNKELNFNLYGPGVGINEIKDFSELAWLRPYSGTLLNPDFLVTGTIERPKVSGGVFVQELRRDAVSLFEIPLNCELEIHPQERTVKLFGTVSAREGWIQSRRTKLLLKESKVTFNGDVLDMQLDLKGEAKIDDVQISVHITGTKDNPQINLTSQPPLSKETLMVMLATGKRWQSLENSLSGGALSSEVAGDFIDFFLFDGPGSKFAQRFGLKDINVTYGQGKQGVGVTSAVTSKVDVGYGVEKTNATELDAATTTQTIEGAYKLTDKVSLELEKKLETQDQTNSLENEANRVQSEDKIMLKFRTKF